jgi:hypothetical protein
MSSAEFFNINPVESKEDTSLRIDTVERIPDTNRWKITGDGIEAGIRLSDGSFIDTIDGSIDGFRFEQNRVCYPTDNPGNKLSYFGQKQGSQLVVTIKTPNTEKKVSFGAGGHYGTDTWSEVSDGRDSVSIVRTPGQVVREMKISWPLEKLPPYTTISTEGGSKGGSFAIRTDAGDYFFSRVADEWIRASTPITFKNLQWGPDNYRKDWPSERARMMAILEQQTATTE